MLLPYLFDTIFPDSGTPVRFLHATPDLGPIDVYINDKLAYKNLSFAKTSKFVQLPAGKYHLALYATGEKATPLLSQHIGVVKWPWLTIALAGTTTSLSLIQVPGCSNKRQSSSIRMVHLAPDLTSVDFYLTGDNRLFNNVTFKELTYFVPVFAGHYNFTINHAGCTTPLVNSLIKVPDNRCYTVYLLGFASKEPSLRILISN